jgi:hypothetical protein
MEFKFANKYGWSDVEPYEVVRVVSEKCVEVRAMKYEQLHKMEELEPHVGGFACHFADQQKQRWDIQPDPEREVVKIRLSNARGKAGYWFDKHGQKFGMAEQPRRFYDYNF